jgi:hypothetical protein
MGEDDYCYLTECERDNMLYLSEVIKDDFDLLAIDMLLKETYSKLGEELS